MSCHAMPTMHYVFPIVVVYTERWETCFEACARMEKNTISKLLYILARSSWCDITALELIFSCLKCFWRNIYSKPTLSDFVPHFDVWGFRSCLRGAKKVS